MNGNISCLIYVYQLSFKRFSHRSVVLNHTEFLGDHGSATIYFKGFSKVILIIFKKGFEDWQLHVLTPTIHRHWFSSYTCSSENFQCSLSPMNVPITNHLQESVFQLMCFSVNGFIFLNVQNIRAIQNALQDVYLGCKCAGYGQNQ